jgi:hypothetical protein
MRLMTYTPDITVSVTDPLAHAEHCLALAVEAADLAADLRLADQHSAAEQQRYYLARARAHAEISKAESLRSIADDLNRIGLAQ